MKQKQYFIFEAEPGDGLEDGPHAIARSTTRRRRKLARLQMITTFIDEQERYRVCQEMLWEDEYIEKKEELDNNEVKVHWSKDLELNKLDFLAKFAELAFPDQPIKGNEDKLDLDEVERAYWDFLPDGGRTRNVLSLLSTEQNSSQSAATRNTPTTSKNQGNTTRQPKRPKKKS